MILLSVNEYLTTLQTLYQTKRLSLRIQIKHALKCEDIFHHLNRRTLFSKILRFMKIYQKTTMMKQNI